ncbi:MAG: hypothetical protein RLY46_1433 [Bacteroidota bacterium]|jgi:pyrimidine operon attenuation protein/uracil phosphoribosyltransferase
MNKKYILTAEKAHMKLRRIAFQILERNTELQSIHIAGIKENGFLLALELKKILEEISSFQIELSAIELDKLNPIDCKIDPTVDFKNKHVLIVDDVVNSGKAMLHAIHPILALSPNNIQTATLVERSYKTYPVHVDYVGVSLATTLEDHISVVFKNGVLQGAYLE